MESRVGGGSGWIFTYYDDMVSGEVVGKFSNVVLIGGFLVGD